MDKAAANINVAKNNIIKLVLLTGKFDRIVNFCGIAFKINLREIKTPKIEGIP
jgi:hypothetical protein